SDRNFACIDQRSSRGSQGIVSRARGHAASGVRRCRRRADNRFEAIGIRDDSTSRAWRGSLRANGRTQRAESVGRFRPRMDAAKPPRSYARSCFAALLVWSSLILVVPVFGASLLTSYLRQDGTQLDLRGANITDPDLASLGDPSFSKVVSVLL